ncbi:hypothetical protein CBR_g248 [Chara braunii]|uniref:Homeobox domain-containing protein n=1 Tax=Chara braunii TaxID=69332 RepID=A0A388JM04_CHABU|nr:hypothetical protein CBR_g248 [Chara braunii]|eukprot:GBG58849.1 hypothetical protein CBR_g248 [Chara braunii]
MGTGTQKRTIYNLYEQGGGHVANGAPTAPTAAGALAGDHQSERVDEVEAPAERKRRLTADQVHSLERNFEMENKLDPERKMQLARELCLQPRQVAVWFQNRRARWKTKQLERDHDALKCKIDQLQAENETLRMEVRRLSALLRVKSEYLDGHREGSPLSGANGASDLGEVVIPVTAAMTVAENLAFGSSCKGREEKPSSSSPLCLLGRNQIGTPSSLAELADSGSGASGIGASLHVSTGVVGGGPSVVRCDSCNSIKLEKDVKDHKDTSSTSSHSSEVLDLDASHLECSATTGRGGRYLSHSHSNSTLDSLLSASDDDPHSLSFSTDNSVETIMDDPRGPFEGESAPPVVPFFISPGEDMDMPWWEWP